MDEPPGRTPGRPKSRTAANANSKRRLCRNCVRWAWNRRRVPTNNGLHRGTSWKRKSLIRMRKEACRYHWVSVTKIAFQACAFIRLRSRVSSSRATARCPAKAAQPRRRTTTRTSLRSSGINSLRAVRNSVTQKPPSTRSDSISDVPSMSCECVGTDRSRRLCKTSKCMPITYARRAAAGACR